MSFYGAVTFPGEQYIYILYIKNSIYIYGLNFSLFSTETAKLLLYRLKSSWPDLFIVSPTVPANF